MNKIKKTKKRQLSLALFLTAFIFVASMIPGALVDKLGVDRNAWGVISTIGHILTYGTLAFILCIYFKFCRTLLNVRLDDKWISALSLILIAIIGGLMEGLQIFSLGRTPQWFDFYCNLIGGTGGITCFFISRWVLKRSPIFSVFTNSITKSESITMVENS